MRREFKFRKRAVLFVLSALLIADVALAAYSWNLSSAQSVQRDLETLRRNRKLLKADIDYAKKTRQDIPAIQKACDEYERTMFPESTGYSSVTSELSAIAAKSGLRLENRAFRANEVKGHAFKEINIDASVRGNYISVVHFLNALQRSPNLYSVESLSARSEQNPATRELLRVSVHLKTYFRAG